MQQLGILRIRIWKRSELASDRIVGENSFGTRKDLGEASEEFRVAFIAVVRNL